MKVIVCGGRDYSDEATVRQRLSVLPEGTIIVHGGAPGADAMAAMVAETLGFQSRAYPAEWSRHGRAAGPMRNLRMLEQEKPDLVIAFPGGHGTRHMTRIARAAGVTVENVE